MPVTQVKPILRRVVMGGSLRATLARAAVLALLVLVFFKFICLPYRVTGPSMQPALMDGQVVFVNALAYWRAPPERGDIVAVRTTGRQVVLVKRVIGLPGETLDIRGGVVYINDKPLQEDYLAGECDWNLDPQVLESGEYLVIGDNRSMDLEDHVFGKVMKHKILGGYLWAF